MNKIIIAMFFTWFAVVLSAQSPLSANDAISKSISANYSVQLAENEQRINQLNFDAAKHAYLPSLDAVIDDVIEYNGINQQYSNGNETSEAGATSNSLTAGIAVNLPIFNGFKLSAEKNKLQAILEQGNAALAVKIADITSQTLQQYYQILYEQKNISSLDKNKQIAEKKLQLAQLKKEQGISDITDVYLSEISVNAIQQTILERQSLLKNNIAALNLTMQEKPDAQWIFTDSIIIDTSLNYEQLSAQILANPSYQEYAQAIAASEWDEKSINAMRFPSANISAGYNYFVNRNDAGFFLVNENFGPYAGITLNIPLYHGGIYKNRTDAAIIQTESLRMEQAAFHDENQNLLYTAWLAYESNLQQLELAKQNKELAQKNIDIELKRYQLNESTILDVNAAEESFISSEDTYNRILLSLKNTEIELLRITGLL